MRVKIDEMRNEKDMYEANAIQFEEKSAFDSVVFVQLTSYYQ